MTFRVTSRVVFYILNGIIFFTAIVWFLMLMRNLAFGSFKDVSNTHANYDAKNLLQTQNIINCYSDKTLHPNEPINRTEIIKIVIITCSSDEFANNNCFPDVITKCFAENNCLTETCNLNAGCFEENFKLTNTMIDFAESAKILLNDIDFQIPSNTDDLEKTSANKLAELQAISASIINLNQKINRREVAKIIYRSMTNVLNKSSEAYEELGTKNNNLPLEQKHLSPGLPMRIQIPNINIDAPFEYVGINSQGAVDAPEDPDKVAWYSGGTRPGDIGSAVITGHLNWYNSTNGIFTNLHKIQLNDKIVIQDDQGIMLSFIVREIRSYNANEEAIDVFISDDGKSHLNLITCEGSWDKVANSFSKRLVIFSDKE